MRVQTSTSEGLAVEKERNEVSMKTTGFYRGLKGENKDEVGSKFNEGVKTLSFVELACARQGTRPTWVPAKMVVLGLPLIA